ncbi:hypothetical protein RRG08_020309 [Elysia crispata]|uniref:Uncharacterized protein n=1 Tax=Elysia crispata TaxID=231223 RepID=A0AAE1DX47_9GAST|nr:hypothetical protein RRG08_020309 [Elysia crispata]
MSSRFKRVFLTCFAPKAVSGEVGQVLYVHSTPTHGVHNSLTHPEYQCFFKSHTWKVRTQILDSLRFNPEADNPEAKTENSKTCGSPSKENSHNPVIPRPREVKLVGHQGYEELINPFKANAIPRP